MTRTETFKLVAMKAAALTVLMAAMVAATLNTAPADAAPMFDPTRPLKVERVTALDKGVQGRVTRGDIIRVRFNRKIEAPAGVNRVHLTLANNVREARFAASVSCSKLAGGLRGKCSIVGHGKVLRVVVTSIGDGGGSLRLSPSYFYRASNVQDRTTNRNTNLYSKPQVRVRDAR